MSTDHEPGLPPADERVNPAPSRGPWIVRCPQCGGTRIRKPTRPLVLNVVACVICLPLTLVMCAMSFGAAIALLALPVTTCIAVVGRNRCLSCRHRFGRDPENAGRAALPRFPWRFHALNIVILVVLCFVTPYIMRKGAGAGRLPDMMMDMRIFMTLGFYLWASLVYHLILHYTLRRRFTNPLIWTVLFILPGVTVGGKVSYGLSPQVHTRALLKYAKLGPLPQSATGIKVYTWSSPFSGEDYLCFTATAADIERFLADSAALQGQQPERFSPQRMRLPHPKDYATSPRGGQDANEYYTPHSTKPKWYKQEIRGPARKYIVQPPRYQLPGEVLVDEETNTVYVYLCFS